MTAIAALRSYNQKSKASSSTTPTEEESRSSITQSEEESSGSSIHINENRSSVSIIDIHFYVYGTIWKLLDKKFCSNFQIVCTKKKARRR